MAAPAMDTGVGSVHLYMKVGSAGSLTKESHATAWKDKGYCDIHSFSLGTSASWNFSSGQSAGGQANISDIVVSRTVMASSVLIFMGCAKEKYTDLMEIIAVDTTGKEVLFAIRLKGEVRMTSCQVGGATGGSLTEGSSWTGKILEIEQTKSSKKEQYDFSNVEQKGDELK